MTTALVPVKPLQAGKSRLLGTLDREQIRALCLAMLGDVLEALAGVEGISQRAVVTPDADVGAAAERAGARALVRDDPGLNASLTAAAEELCAEQDALLVVLGDVAGARSEDLGRLLAALGDLGGRGVVLAPSRDGGTSALLRAPHDVIPNRFGPESAKAHRRAAEAARVPYRELALPSLALDVDRPEDLRGLARGDAAAPRTRALLDELGPAAP